MRKTEKSLNGRDTLSRGNVKDKKRQTLVNTLCNPVLMPQNNPVRNQISAVWQLHLKGLSEVLDTLLWNDSAGGEDREQLV